MCNGYVKQVMNDLFTLTVVGQQRSRMTRLIITTAQRFLASKNQFQLAILEFGDLGHQIGSFIPTQQKKTLSKLDREPNYQGHSKS